MNRTTNHPQSLSDNAVRIATAVAARLFKARARGGRENYEVHLSKFELECVIATGITVAENLKAAVPAQFTSSEPDICPCCGEDMAPGQSFCCTDEFPEAGDIRETGR